MNHPYLPTNSCSPWKFHPSNDDHNSNTSRQTNDTEICEIKLRDLPNRIVELKLSTKKSGEFPTNGLYQQKSSNRINPKSTKFPLDFPNKPTKKYQAWSSFGKWRYIRQLESLNRKCPTPGWWWIFGNSQNIWKIPPKKGLNGSGGKRCLTIIKYDQAIILPNQHSYESLWSLGIRWLRNQIVPGIL